MRENPSRGRVDPSRTQDGSNHGAALVEGLEAFFSAPVEEIAKSFRREIGDGSLPIFQVALEDFLDEYAVQVRSSAFERAPAPFESSWWPLERRNPSKTLSKKIVRERSAHISHLPIPEVGDTRPVSLLRRADRDPWGRSAPSMDAKNLLLYNEQAVLLDPFFTASRQYETNSLSRPLVPAAPHFDSEELPRAEWLARSLELYADFAPAFRAGLLDLQPILTTHGGHSALVVGEKHARMWEIETGESRNVRRINRVALDLLLPIQAAALAPGRVHPIARPGFEEALLAYYYRILNPRARSSRSAVSEITRTTARLLMLNLPGVQHARTVDLVNVRADATFADVREGVHRAVSNAAQEADLLKAQAAAQETFRDLIPKKRELSRALKKSFILKLVNYGVGAAVAVDVVNWQAALPIFATVGVDLAIDAHTTRAQRAQRNLYVAMSRN